MAIPRYTNFDRHVSEMPKAELIKMCKPLQKKSGKYQKSSLMRSLIINERDFLKVDYMRGQRRFWYSTIKPALEKLDQLTESDLTKEGLKNWDAELSRYIADLVRSDGLTYRELNIEDNSRKLELPGNRFVNISLSTYGYQVSIAPYSNIILCTEKDTIYSNIEDIATLFGCTCLSGKGQNALAAMEKLLWGMGSVENDIHILALTDYDPPGYDISDTFKNQIEDLLPVLGQEAKVHIERIGIRPDQLTHEEVENNKYTPKAENQTQKDKWMEATGGINGEFKGLELDALPPERIRSIFASSLKKYVKTDQYSTFVKKSYIRKQVLESLQHKMNDIVDGAIHQEIGQIELYDFDIFELAEQGRRTIPIDRLCSANRDQAIHEIAFSYMR